MGEIEGGALSGKSSRKFSSKNGGASHGAKDDVSVQNSKLVNMSENGESEQCLSSNSEDTIGRKSSNRKNGARRVDSDEKKDWNKLIPLKKRKVKFATPKDPVYEFFGPNNPHTSKLTALRCLDFLDDKDIYTMSQVNKLWSIAAMDDALWE